MSQYTSSTTIIIKIKKKTVTGCKKKKKDFKEKVQMTYNSLHSWSVTVKM
jgi:hypothetical protein